MISVKQWEKHEEHMNDHISWPATKKDILEACKGEDVEPEVMEQLNALEDRDYESPQDLKSVLVKEE